jgi:hypothetical protein
LTIFDDRMRLLLPLRLIAELKIAKTAHCLDCSNSEICCF